MTGMKLAIAVIAIAASGVAAAQNFTLRVPRQPIQIRVRHADPWAVKTLLEGGQLRSPEISTVMALMGVPQNNQGTGTPLFPDGKFIVNPGDNSLWFIPNP